MAPKYDMYPKPVGEKKNKLGKNAGHLNQKTVIS